MRVAFASLLVGLVLIVFLTVAVFRYKPASDIQPYRTPAQVIHDKYPRAVLHGTSWADPKLPVVFANIDGIRGYFILSLVKGRWIIVHAEAD